ncbi:broad-complex isoform Z4 [Danaus plexippus plexippus]|uniref:Broad-complex isoform Z4 n=1 Tax=Danaus plexippus plexippus TaxID=278856 RepID=A0A212FHG1_DANPL|nr:broad-complex isoform Z4 [Danaus plexippus plexippus]
MLACKRAPSSLVLGPRVRGATTERLHELALLEPIGTSMIGTRITTNAILQKSALVHKIATRQKFGGTELCQLVPSKWDPLDASGRCGVVGPLGAGHRCEVCGKLLSTRLTLKRHTEQQHLQPLHSARCSLCHKVFRTLNSLNNHKSIYHRRQRGLPQHASQAAPPQNLSTGVDSKLTPPPHAIDFYKFKDQFNV